MADRFEALGSVNDLAVLVKKEVKTLQKFAERPPYQSFYLPKPGGAKRFIEHPGPALKALQTEVSRYLQAVYHFIRPDCAHGFVLSTPEEENPRTIYSNALAHVRGHWFLNLDISDFFHAITMRHLMNLFERVFWFPKPLAELVSRLCTHNGRLPMGAPSSPVLSNLIFYFTDHALTELSHAHNGVYTRYADDLTFSFPRPPADEFLENVRFLLMKECFTLNEKKLRLQGRLETPEITGLCVGKGSKPVLSKSFLKTLKQEVTVYRWLVTETVQKRGVFPPWFYDQYRRSLLGQIEFVGFVLGKGDRTYRKLLGKMSWWDISPDK